MYSFKISCYEISKLANDIISYKEGKSRLWCFGASNCFVIEENLRKRALLKNFNAAHSRKRKANSRFMKPWK